MEILRHETFLMLVRGYWEAATEAARDKFLETLFGDEGADNFEDSCTLEHAVLRFEDTRTEEEVNAMLVAFTQLGMDLWVWHDETETYTLG